MVVFPNCKINLGLHITNKRTDGFHDLQTVFYPVGLKEALEIIPAHDSDTDVIFSCSGLVVDGKEEQNSCIKAYRLLKKDFPQLPSIKMHLHKVIPMGAGLGGGSADGAFALQLLNNKFKLGLEEKQLLPYAAELGSDCAFFIINKPCYATGRGEILEPVAIDLSAYDILLVNPGIHVNTGWAFSQLTSTVPSVSIKEIIAQPIQTWKAHLTNDFEQPVFQKYPPISAIKDMLYQNGAWYAAMSGSGSTVFGIFEKGKAIISGIPESYYTAIV
ncbi:MAG: 4-(cytidine 5'-diphospho)-2-C-methyl-D-erythritol kinase [Bacteroidetes bacterium]|nr:4-(cytidine 5'-diphospho)-2-C-methyl-D-erythritol kinase [Bacteroidota bacterium]